MDWWLQLVLPSVSTISNSFSILHQVPEGHVGVYWRGGALLKTITDPGNLHWTFSHLLAYSFNLACFSLFYNSGFHLKLPLITQYEPVQVTLQTDQVILWSNLWRLRILPLHSFTLNFGILFFLQVKDIPCGTKGGVMINFEKIEVPHYESLLCWHFKILLNWDL